MVLAKTFGKFLEFGFHPRHAIGLAGDEVLCDQTSATGIALERRVGLAQSAAARALFEKWETAGLAIIEKQEPAAVGDLFGQWATVLAIEKKQVAQAVQAENWRPDQEATFKEKMRERKATHQGEEEEVHRFLGRPVESDVRIDTFRKVFSHTMCHGVSMEPDSKSVGRVPTALRCTWFAKPCFPTVGRKRRSRVKKPPWKEK